MKLGSGCLVLRGARRIGVNTLFDLSVDLLVRIKELRSPFSGIFVEIGCIVHASTARCVARHGDAPFDLAIYSRSPGHRPGSRKVETCSKQVARL